MPVANSQTVSWAILKFSGIERFGEGVGGKLCQFFADQISGIVRESLERLCSLFGEDNFVHAPVLAHC